MNQLPPDTLHRHDFIPFLHLNTLERLRSFMRDKKPECFALQDEIARDLRLSTGAPVAVDDLPEEITSLLEPPASSSNADGDAVASSGEFQQKNYNALALQGVS